jgi:hypothetical protein
MFRILHIFKNIQTIITFTIHRNMRWTFTTNSQQRGLIRYNVSWTLVPLFCQSKCQIDNFLSINNNKGRFIIVIENIKVCTNQMFKKLVSSWIDASASPYSVMCINITSNNELQVVSAAGVDDIP